MTCGLPATKRSSAARSLHSLLHHGAQPTAASGASLGFQRQDISHLRQFMAFAQQQQHARPTSQQPDPCGTNSPTTLLGCMRLDDAASMQQALYKLYSHQPAVLCDLLLHFITTLSQLPAPGSTSKPACGGAGVSLSTLEHKLRRLAAFIKHAQAQAQAQPAITPAVVPAASAAAASAQAASAAAPPSTDDDAPSWTVGAAVTAAMQPSAMQQAAGGCASDAHPNSSMQQHVNLLDRYHPIWSRLHDALKAVEQAQPHSRAPRGKRRRPAGDTHSTGEEQQQQPASPSKRFAPGTSSSAHSTCSLHQTEASASQEGCTLRQQGGNPPDGCPSHASHSSDAAAEAGASRLCPTHPESGGGGAGAADPQAQLSTQEPRSRTACALKIGAAASDRQQQQHAAPCLGASAQAQRPSFNFSTGTNTAAYPVVMLGAAPMLMLPGMGMGLGLGMGISPLLPMSMLLGMSQLDSAHPVIAARAAAAAAAAEIQAAALAACALPPWLALPSSCRPMPHGPSGTSAPRLSAAPPPPLVPVPAAPALPHIFRPLARLPGGPPPAHQAPPACHARLACRTTPDCQVGALQSNAGASKPSAATVPAADAGVAGEVQHGGTAPVDPALPQAVEGAAGQPAAPALRQTAQAVLGSAAGPVCRADTSADAATGGKADANSQVPTGTETEAGTDAAAGRQAIAVTEATGPDAPADRPANLPAGPKADLPTGPCADTKADAPAGHPAPVPGSTLPCTTAPSSFARLPGPAVKDLLPPGLLPPHHAMQPALHQSSGKTLVGTAAAARATVLPGPPVKDLLPLNLVPPRTALAPSRAVRADSRKDSAAAATAATAAAVAKGAGRSLRPAPAAGAAAGIALLQRYLPERNRQLQAKQQASSCVMP